ncbi:alpha/beta hydrolase [Kineococcus rhizosphaerae]|uniref:S-formylglutathione hydrolase FrmB n=1 Tax=Kineococcus rhizosphaerae TaxID=559628 RepID=A0A2T0R0D7_9ACTN|nr:alpha/beta hydrolase-fold protein [Kineococcus rhizosphaerae]PRY12564.1 S-formylglutathione hydrolase FrmB [Kineococcus rhizosphaerae]
MPRPARRAVLAATAGAVVLAGAGALTLDDPLRSSVRRRLGIGRVDATVPAAGADGPRYATFASAARGRDVTWGWSAPPGHEARGLPVLLTLHGRGVDARAAFTQLGMHEFLAAHVAAGGAPLAVVSVDGGSAYWHPRAAGDDPLTMLGGELWPRLAATGFDLSRWAVAGWSMGGFGALLLTREAVAGRFTPGGTLVAAGAGSPALFASAGATSPGSFDDPGDWRRWGDLVAGPGTGDVALTVSCGRDDPFREQTERYRAACRPAPAGGIGDGAHTTGYWRSLVPDWLRLAAARLTA